MNKRAKFWWKVREAWHRPSMYAQCYWPIYEAQYFLKPNWACLKLYFGQKMLQQDFKTFRKRAWMGFTIIQPFSCKSGFSGQKKWYMPQWWC